MSGHGLALAAVVIEQDNAYFEVHVVEMPEGGSVEALFGVATKKDRKFYKALEGGEEGMFQLFTFIEQFLRTVF